MSLPILKKYPQEAKTITFDFSEKLAIGDSLSGTVGVGSSAGITLGAPTADLVTATVTVRVSGGTAGSSYEARCEADTTLGDHLKLAATVEVSNDAN